MEDIYWIDCHNNYISFFKMCVNLYIYYPNSELNSINSFCLSLNNHNKKIHNKWNNPCSLDLRVNVYMYIFAFIHPNYEYIFFHFSNRLMQRNNYNSTVLSSQQVTHNPDRFCWKCKLSNPKLDSMIVDTRREWDVIVKKM